MQDNLTRMKKKKMRIYTVLLVLGIIVLISGIVIATSTDKTLWGGVIGAIGAITVALDVLELRRIKKQK